MRIQNFNNNACSYKANLKSPKLKFVQKDFFVPIKGYGKNTIWANTAKSTADMAVNLIRNNTAVENVLKIISTGIRLANSLGKDIIKAAHSGILRTKREGWICDSDWSGLVLWTNYSRDRKYKVYKNKLDQIAKKPLTNPYNDIGLTIPVVDKKEGFLKHPDPKYINSAFKHIADIYSNFKNNFNSKDINNSQLKDVNDDIAEIRWILAHSMPWERGSDAISNVLIRAMYKSIGIKSYPLKKGLSLDLEAFCTELKDYKAKFPSFFEKPPEIID